MENPLNSSLFFYASIDYFLGFYEGKKQLNIQPHRASLFTQLGILFPVNLLHNSSEKLLQLFCTI